MMFGLFCVLISGTSFITCSVLCAVNVWFIVLVFLPVVVFFGVSLLQLN